jgi:hypothetical protein
VAEALKQGRELGPRDSDVAVGGTPAPFSPPPTAAGTRTPPRPRPWPAAAPTTAAAAVTWSGGQGGTGRAWASSPAGRCGGAARRGSREPRGRGAWM